VDRETHDNKIDYRYEKRQVQETYKRPKRVDNPGDGETKVGEEAKVTKEESE
jgi:hypothetical protein